jgi:large subunit ribosomal protein L3
MKGILGRKAGMTQIFTQDGKTLPVTVVEIKPNTVLQVKTKDIDSYDSIQLGYEEKKKMKNSTKAAIGHAKKANAKPVYFIKEVRGMQGFELGQKINTSDIFKNGDIIDVVGISKGKGFQGSIKRHGHSIGPMAHGSKYHRGTGSLGDMTSVVKKNKKMPGQMGGDQVTVRNLQIVKIDRTNNAVLIKGSIPGPNKGFVLLQDSVLQPGANKPVTLVNIKEESEKLHLLEEAKKVGANLSTKMEIHEMEDVIKEAAEHHAKELKEKQDRHDKAKELGINIDGKTEEQIIESIEKHDGEAPAKKAEAPKVEEAKPAEAKPAEENKDN